MLILVADKSKQSLTQIQDHLKELGHRVLSAGSIVQILEIFQTQRADMILLNIEIASLNQFESIHALRSLCKEQWVPIVYLCNDDTDPRIIEGIDKGGDDYLVAPFNDVRLAIKIKALQHLLEIRQKLQEAIHQVSHLAATDPLTGLYNRVQFEKTFHEKISHVNRHKCIFALLFVDLDKFYKLNECYGQKVGDLALIEVAKRLKSYLRLDDFIARIDGDEFAVLLSEIEDADVAQKVAQKVIDIISEPFHLEGHHIYMSCNIGITFYPFANTNPDGVIEHATLAMEYAKQLGLNKFQQFIPELLNDHSQKKGTKIPH